jgi:hypothetical protein
MPPVGFEPKISVLERAKTVRALDRAATAIGWIVTWQSCSPHHEITGLPIPFLFRRLNVVLSMDMRMSAVHCCLFELYAILSKLLHSINKVVVLSRIVSFKMRTPRLTEPHTGARAREKERESSSRRAEDFSDLSNTGTPISALFRSVYTSTATIAPRDGNLIYNRAGKWHYQ